MPRTTHYKHYPAVPYPNVFKIHIQRPRYPYPGNFGSTSVHLPAQQRTVNTDRQPIRRRKRRHETAWTQKRLLITLDLRRWQYNFNRNISLSTWPMRKGRRTLVIGYGSKDWIKRWAPTSYCSDVKWGMCLRRREDGSLIFVFVIVYAYFWQERIRLGQSQENRKYTNRQGKTAIRQGVANINIPSNNVI